VSAASCRPAGTRRSGPASEVEAVGPSGLVEVVSVEVFGLVEVVSVEVEPSGLVDGRRDPAFRRASFAVSALLVQTLVQTGEGVSLTCCPVTSSDGEPLP